MDHVRRAALLAVVLCSLTPAVAQADPLPITAALSQVATGFDATTNLESVAVTGSFGNFVAPYHYVFAVRGNVVIIGDDSLPAVTVSLTNNCSITTQSVSVTITDASGLTATANGTLDHSLCPPPPAVDHAADLIMSAPTVSLASFVDHLRADGSPALASGAAIYAELIADRVNPAFALGLFYAESHSGTKGYAVTTLNWGNMLYHSWQAAYGAVPFLAPNGYTYAQFPSWFDGIRAFAWLVADYYDGGYITVSEASARWLGTIEGSSRHLDYLKNITSVMLLLPVDSVVHLSTLAPVSRLAGADRYATASAISSASFAPGVPVVFVATGTDFPDALAAGPAAATLNGPVLLVNGSTIPETVAAEMRRLAPAHIVIVGGLGVISAAVESQLRAFAPAVDRLAGADRYATAAAISAAVFAPGVPAVYVATGTNFPDALAGGAVAAKNGSPVLLVEPNQLPGATAAEIARLHPTAIVILGGVGAVSDAVASALGALAPVSRIAGPDRYATATAISAANYAPNVLVSYVATGNNFPDALAGVPAAGRAGGPLLIVPGTSIPASVAAELIRLRPAKIIVLGGTGVVSQAVAGD